MLDCRYFLIFGFLAYGAASAEEAKPPLYQQVLDGLRDKPFVLPAMPYDVHPVHTVYNPEAIIPPQCYTRTEQKNNPCYTCHQEAIPGRENAMNDGIQQRAYLFSEVGVTNHWQNLFEDRSARVAAISDAAILAWVAQDNYSELAPRLKGVKFQGWIPDLQNLQQGRAAFDEHGFAKDGSHWVAFNYKPLPSTFWPTNGSTDDVMIRLAEPFRTDAKGQYSADIYKANLAIVEAKIKNLDAISTLPIDENAVGVDLDGDGKLGAIDHITVLDHYVGAAQKEFIDSFMYPKDTEFLHTVRYLAVDDGGGITPSTRMKEVRYMRKWQVYSKTMYRRYYEEESYEKDAGALPRYTDLGQHGLDNGTGWSVQGFIEDKNGRLRASTYEENMFCMGCHASIGSTIDQTFGFPRKVDGAKGWGYINLKGMADAPNYGELKGEILTYLERVGGGDEFRNNGEMLQRWFKADGAVDHEKVMQAKDVYTLVTPSKERALLLDKAYKSIVEDQDFIFGRDATVTPVRNVYDKIDPKTAPTLPDDKTYRWDIRLKW